MRNILITALAASTLALAACGGGAVGIGNAGDGDGFDRTAMAETLRGHGLEGTVASCVAAGLTEQLTPGMYDELLAAATADDIPTLRLRVVGDGEDLASLRALVDDLGITERVDFVGRVPYAEIRSHLDGAWVGANVPKPDDLGELSFSNKVVEWVSIGLPVLAARTATMLRYFPEGTLFYTTGGDVEAIGRTLRALDAMDPGAIDANVDAARASLEAISWPVQRARLLEVVEGPPT